MLLSRTTLPQISHCSAIMRENCSGDTAGVVMVVASSRSFTDGTCMICGDLLVQAPHDRLRRAGRREQAQPEVDRQLRDLQLLGQRGHVGNRARARHRHLRHVAQRAGLHVRPRGEDVRDHHVDLPAEQRRQRGAGAAVGDVRHLDVRLAREQLHGEVADRADALRAEVDLARILLRILDQLAAGLRTGSEARTVTGEEPLCVSATGTKALVES